MASLPLNNHKSRDVSSPSLHNPLTQPGAPLAHTSGNVNVAVAELSSNTNHIPPHAPSRPVVTTRDSSDVTSFESLRLAADRGDAHAQYKLGRKYADKRGDAKDYAEAVKYYQLAAEQGFANAQTNLGIMYQKGSGVAQNYAEAVKYYRLAADQGNAAAQYNLGTMYEDAKGAAQNYAEAVKYYRLAADQGNVTAQYNLGTMYEDAEGVAQNYAEAVKYYQLAANQGCADAQSNLGFMYVHGHGVAQNYAEAIKLYQLAADQGNAFARCSLGFMYENGQGVVENHVESVKYYQLAADQGSDFAQSKLGFRYANGQGVAQNHAEAVKYYQLAADQGDITAQWNLGSMYEDGLGVAQSYDKAVKYYRLAADQGDAPALRHLGELYRDGKGLPLDAEKALRYFWKSRQSKNVIDLSSLGVSDNLLQHLPRMFEEFGGYGQIKGLPSIIELNLSNNPITDIGAPFIALILKHTQTLTKLSLKWTDLTDQGRKPIFDALSNYNVSVLSCTYDATFLRSRNATAQNQAIKIIMDELDKNYPTSTPKPFDILPMEVVRQLLQTIAVVNTKNPASFYQSIVTSVSSMLGYQHATTEQVMSEVYNILMSDLASASHKGE